MKNSNRTVSQASSRSSLISFVEESSRWPVNIPEAHIGDPPSCSRLANLTGRFLMKIGGWTLIKRPLTIKNFVIIAAPHTSNWDLLWLLGAAWSIGVKINWLVKESVFRGPFGVILRSMGGIAVKRDKPGRLVETLSERFDDLAGLGLVIPPEGTRQHLDHWKSGFYRIAESTSVPILCSFLDYKHRVTGIGPIIVTSQNMKSDMDLVRSFYQPMTARYPKDQSRIRLLDE